ncbi:hypothetical protein GJ496_008749 [Pomphorhynchus laevis]|nr:hypothetical protein GJ496_008749 [Pomphorhynchus laevis]
MELNISDPLFPFRTQTTSKRVDNILKEHLRRQLILNENQNRLIEEFQSTTWPEVDEFRVPSERLMNIEAPFEERRRHEYTLDGRLLVWRSFQKNQRTTNHRDNGVSNLMQGHLNKSDDQKFESVHQRALAAENILKPRSGLEAFQQSINSIIGDESQMKEQMRKAIVQLFTPETATRIKATKSSPQTVQRSAQRQREQDEQLDEDREAFDTIY